MKDPQLAIRTAYYTALNGTVTLSGLPVGVYDRVPSAAVYPYIILSTQTTADGPRGKRDCFLSDSTLLLDIVTAYDGSEGGKRDSDLIAAQCIDILTGEDEDYSLPALDGFRISRVQMEFTTTQEEKDETHYYVRRLLRFRNTVEQL